MEANEIAKRLDEVLRSIPDYGTKSNSPEQMNIDLQLIIDKLGDEAGQCIIEAISDYTVHYG